VPRSSTTTISRRWITRLVVGAVTAAIAAVTLPSGGAVADEPVALSAIPAVVPFQPRPQPQPGLPSAAVEQRTRVLWEARGRPTAMVVVRSSTVDLVGGGSLDRRIPRRQGDLTLTALNRYLPAGWLSITDSTARLAATVVLTPGVTLDVGGEVTTLKLVGGATSPEAASIYTGGGRLTLRGATVTSADRSTGQAMPPSPGRPFIVVAPRGRLDAVDATISDLGTQRTDSEDRPAVQFAAGSSGSLTGTSFLRNGTGLQLSGSQDVRLDAVTVSESTGDGLVLRGDRGTTMSGIRTERNGGYGVRVTGASTDRPVTGITTTGNGKFGVFVGADDTRIAGVTTSGDVSGGIEVARSNSVTVTDSTATDEPVGVFTHLGATNTVLDRLKITGGRRGVEIEKTTNGLTVQASTIAGAKVAGVSVGGNEVQLRDLSVSDSRTAVRVERGAVGVTVVGLTLSGGQDGVVATPGTERVVLQNLKADGVENESVRSFSPDIRIVGGTITGGLTGINSGSTATIAGTSITLTNEGIRAQSGGAVRVDEVDVDAVAVGINAQPGSPVLLTGSRVHALEAIRGEVSQAGVNDLSLPPLSLLGAIGIPLVLLALLLELVHTVRQRRGGGGTERRTPPTLEARQTPTGSSGSPATRSTPRREHSPEALAAKA
jgi:Right handed beta helix region